MVGCVARPVSKGMEKFRGKSPDVYVWEPPRAPGTWPCPGGATSGALHINSIGLYVQKVLTHLIL